MYTMDEEEYKGIFLDFHVKNMVDLVQEYGVTDFINMCTKNKCMVCLGENKEWNSIVLPCLHTVHTRCYANYVATKKKLLCPICGDLKNQWKDNGCIVCKMGRNKYFEDYFAHWKCLEHCEAKLKN